MILQTYKSRYYALSVLAGIFVMLMRRTYNHTLNGLLEWNTLIELIVTYLGVTVLCGLASALIMHFSPYFTGRDLGKSDTHMVLCIVNASVTAFALAVCMVNLNAFR